jgi:CDP-4-dehydro-6-deoxyglucose reductase/3-phenylpropionate/trans-cinnamate dioxygenase ferredoxin reductase subunit
MSFQVRVAGGDITFDCAADESILDAAERAGFSLPHSCRKGVCHTCEGSLVAGEVRVRSRRVTGKADAVLMCQARPCAHVEVAPKRIERRAPPLRKTLTATVFRVARPARDVSILTLRFANGVRARFQAGQYLQVLLPDGDRRNFSLANSPHDNDAVELHIRHVPGGCFSEGILAALGPGDRLVVELPFGEFFLRLAEVPAILLATGTGFAPIKSILEAALRRGDRRPMRLYWGGRTKPDLYMLDRVAKWQDRASWFSFVPVLSQAGVGWNGRTGLVHRAVLEDYPDMANVEVYACGNPLMIAAARKEFGEAAGLPQARFYADAFVASGRSELAA